MAKPPKAKSTGAYKSVGTTYDGVSVLEPKTRSKKFTSSQIRSAIEQVLSDSGVEPRKERNKGNIHVEPRPGGVYAVKRQNAKRASAIADTQAEAIARAKAIAPDKKPLVRRVRSSKNGAAGTFRKS